MLLYNGGLLLACGSAFLGNCILLGKGLVVVLIYMYGCLTPSYNEGFIWAVSHTSKIEIFGITHFVFVTLKGDFIGLGLLKLKSSDFLGLFYVRSAVFYFLSFAPLLFSDIGSV